MCEKESANKYVRGSEREREREGGSRKSVISFLQGEFCTTATACMPNTR